MIKSFSRLTLALALAIGAATASAQTPNDPEPPTPSKFARYALEAERDAPADYVRDILVLVDLDEAQFARPLLDELVGMNLTDEQRAALVEQVGTAAMMRLARTEQLGDARRDFVAQSMQAAGRLSASPERLAKLIDQATSENAASRRNATARLQSAGEAAVVACLTALAAETDQTKQNRLRETLVRMAPDSTPAVAAALDAPRESIRQQAAWALGRIGDRLSLPRLAAMAAGPDANTGAGKAARWAVKEMTGASVTPAAAMRLLDASLDQALAGVPPRRANANGQVAVWAWSEASNQPVSTLLDAKEASQVHAAHLAYDLWRLDEGSHELLTQALTLKLHANWLQVSSRIAMPALPGPELSETPGPLLSTALRLAEEHKLTGAAISLATELGDRRVVDVLYTPDGKPSPLAAALDSAHPAVRFAALEAVMKLKPQAPFPGSSRVTQALLHFATSDGSAAAVVAMPKTEDAATVGGFLMSLGIETAITNRGDAATCKLIEDADVELVVLDLALLRPRVREVLFRLRRQSQTSLVPIAILAPEGRLDEAKRIARLHERTLAVPRPHSAESVVGIVQRLRALAPSGLPDADARARQSAAVAGWVQTLLEEGPAFYNLRNRDEELLAAVNRVPDAAAAIPSLKLLGTPESQRSLVNLASLDLLPIESRRAAAEAFDYSVQHHGLLLTTQQMLDQYDRYNASRDMQAPVQQVLGAVLDSIESLREVSLTKPGQ